MRPAVNIELKAVDPDPEATVRACRALGASDEGVLAQRDTYFAAPGGRLKLRQDRARGGAELILYRRPEAFGLRRSRYRRVPVTEPEALRELLEEAFGVVGVVEKRRRLFLHRNVRIHLDDVEGLGRFIEFESVLAGEGEPSPQEDAALSEVVAALDLEGRETVAGGYLDLRARV